MQKGRMIDLRPPERAARSMGVGAGGTPQGVWKVKDVAVYMTPFAINRSKERLSFTLRLVYASDTPQR